MAIFPTPSIGMQAPQYWDMYQPNVDDFQTLDAYQAALQDYQNWLATTRGGQPAGVAPTTDPVTGWRSAGSQRMADMSQGEYQAGRLNSRLQQSAARAVNNPDHPDTRNFLLAMNSRAQVRPEEMQDAYMAMNQDGSPILSEPLIALLERLGIRPEQYTPTGSGTLPATGPGGGNNPDLPDFTPPDFVPRPGMGGDYSMAPEYGGIAQPKPLPGSFPGGDSNPIGGMPTQAGGGGGGPSPMMLAFEQRLKERLMGGGPQPSEMPQAAYGYRG